MPILHDDGAWMQLRHHGLPISGLQGGGQVNIRGTDAFPSPRHLPSVSPVLTFPSLFLTKDDRHGSPSPQPMSECSMQEAAECPLLLPALSPWDLGLACM